jgi:hypothetical protein
MSYDQHQEKSYAVEPQSAYEAAMKAVEKLSGKLVSSSAEDGRFEVKFPKTVLGKVLGERTYLSCAIRAQDGGSLVVLDAYPLDALERKLMFGARKGVTQTVVTWFTAHMEHNMGLPVK